MDLNYLTNIRKINIEASINAAIANVRKVLSDLTFERTCLIYSSYIFEELKRQFITVRLINTLDLGYNYEHQFLLVPTKEGHYYLIDLTFGQFQNNMAEFQDLLNLGYQKVNNELLACYLKIVSLGEDKNISLEEVFWLCEGKKR